MDDEPEDDGVSTSRGDLRVLLGAAPGVGKTYAMLNEGRRLLAEGHDVVIGIVETHGRAETIAQIGDLEIVPPRVVRHGTIDIPEMDIDAIVVRKPEIVLVDELAHTNAPGSRHAKRYMDVEELREHGIDVITTVNIQHLAELQDVVASVTGVTVNESIPDRVLDDATDVHLIDLPVEVLLRRLEQGKIYPEARANQALTRFFTAGNLTALRELALRRTAEGVDDRLAGMMLGAPAENQAAERVLVLVTPHAQWDVVLRNGWRLASAIHAELLALTLAPYGDLAMLDPRIRPALMTHRDLSRDLGARTITWSDQSGSLRDQAAAIAEVVRSERVTILVGGVERRRKALRGGWGGLDLLTAVLEQTSGVDLHLIRLPESRR